VATFGTGHDHAGTGFINYHVVAARWAAKLDIHEPRVSFPQRDERLNPYRRRRKGF
jgi:hypothetical protein